MKRAFIYTYSEARKRQDFLPPFMAKRRSNPHDDQLNLCRAFARQRGFRVVGCYGGAYETIPRHHRSLMVREIKRSSVEVVIIVTADRLSRILRDWLRVAREIREAGAEIWAVQRGPGSIHQSIREIINYP